ncbi:MAG: BMP family ABC transporter substrate-binding protein [Eubacterium sp.]|nr:BMP family ABC transporter substrate-binding protein [Eubacterium sp.]
MTADDYKKALKAGKKSYQTRRINGQPPTLPVLDEIVSSINIVAQVNLGLINIPLEQINGTKTFGRSQAFAPNYMPLLEPESEFADKWIALGTSQQREGIREPIKAYEFMNEFYVEEGNKRVSVMKYLEADSIPGEVIRLLPRRTKDREVVAYYEFLDFNELSGLCRIEFQNPGDYQKLIRLLGFSETEEWTEQEKRDLDSAFYRFSKSFSEYYKVKDRRKRSKAFLSFLTICDFQVIKEWSDTELKQKILACDKEFMSFREEDSVILNMDPVPAKKSLFPLLFPLPKKRQRVAFVYDEMPDQSSWIYAHELGRLYLEHTFPKEIETSVYVCSDMTQVESVLTGIRESGCNIIFTTSPAFVAGSVKAAVENPDLCIFNCSLTTPHRSIRTYYARMYEAKFLMGAIAGAMAKEGRIYYLADMPINGTIASINAFAFGAKMINPRARIWLDWLSAKKKQIDETERFEVYSGKDLSVGEDDRWQTGLYRIKDDRIERLGVPVYHWGVFYEKLIRSVLDGTWSRDEKKELKTIHYWWGMSAGVLEVFFSKNLPIGTRRLITLLRKEISSGGFNPFSGILYSQEGVVQDKMEEILQPEEIASMNWLAENVTGSIPKAEEVKKKALPVVEEQGVIS